MFGLFQCDKLDSAESIKAFINMWQNSSNGSEPFKVNLGLYVTLLSNERRFSLGLSRQWASIHTVGLVMLVHLKDSVVCEQGDIFPLKLRDADLVFY